MADGGPEALLAYRVFWFSLLVCLLGSDAMAARAKDVGRFFGVRDNTLTGPGLVVGLRRTGDSPSNAATIRSIVSRLQGQGVSLGLDDVTSRNAALVMVRATLPPDYRAGDRVDVTVASAADASSLEGGVLMWTPLFDQSGELVAVAEGPLVVGGFAADAAGNAVRKNSPTSGMVPGGAIVERENPRAVDYSAIEVADFVLDKPDFVTAERLAAAINGSLGNELAQPTSSSTVQITVPDELKGRFPIFAARIETIEFELDAPARVVISERTGTVVMGGDVTIAPVAVAHGGLTVEVTQINAAVQPAPFSRGTTATISNTQVQAEEQDADLVLVEGAQIADLVAALNAMGVKPRELVVILHAIREAGALQAEIVVL